MTVEKPRLAVVVLLLAVAACGNNKSVSTTDTQSAGRSDPTPVASPSLTKQSGSSLMLAAVEPFESLTETAFSATLPEIDKSIAAAVAAVKSIQTSISADVNISLQNHLEAIRQARAAGNQADLALASIEAFKDVVNAVPERTVPADVSLLDYAGLRDDSDAQAKPPRWDDMLKATEYARQRVATLSSAAPAAKLLPNMTAAITKMENAVKARDIAAARIAAKAQLDLVDTLEQAFAPVK